MNKFLLNIVKVLFGILIIVSSIFTVGLIREKIPDKGTFQELLLGDCVPDTEFDTVLMMKYTNELDSDRELLLREDTDAENINKLVSYLGKLELVEHSEHLMSKGEIEYIITIQTKKEGNIGLLIYSSNYVRARSSVKNQKSIFNFFIPYSKKKSKGYKIKNKEELVDFVENYFNFMPKK